MIVNPKKTAEQLAKACDEAYIKYPKSCSHSAWYVIQKYKYNQTHMVANQLIDYISSSSDWKEIQLSELSQLASDGVLIVGGRKELEHGHVIIVYPGPEKARGGYYNYNKATKDNVMISEKGSYARAMSTSMGSWPGAMSNGDKTVWDPWGKDAKFKTVKFWKYVGSVKSGASLSSPLKSIKKSAGAKTNQKPKWQGKATPKEHNKWTFKTITDCTHALAAKWQKVFR